MARSRFTRLAKDRIQVTKRDRSLITDLFTHHAMVRSHLIDLGYFTSVARCNARLRQLFDLGYVDRHLLPEAPYGAQAIYTAGSQSAAMLAEELDWEVADVRTMLRRGTPLFLRHTLAIVDFRAELERASRNAGIKLIRWLPERLCTQAFEVRPMGATSGAWRSHLFRPDAHFCLGDVNHRDYFVEIDRGHTGSRQFREKLDTYLVYDRSGLSAERYGAGRTGFTVLVVTTGSERASRLVALAQDAGLSAARFTTFDLVKQYGPLADIWRSPSSSRLTGLV